MKNNICTFVVNDNLVNGLNSISTYLNVNYKGDKESSEEKVTEMVEANSIGDNSSLYYISKMGVESTTAGLGAMVSYLAIYMGVIFLITSAAVLTQQLCESPDNVYRYELLKKVGVDEKVINKSLFTQIGMLLFYHSFSTCDNSLYSGIKVLTRNSIVGNGSMMKYILITLLILIVVYGGYFIATYNNAKKMIK